jgi:uncharacterized protein YbjT (DUF2867 family)
MINRIVTVFGATGFLGRRIVRRLAGQGFSGPSRGIPSLNRYVAISETKTRLQRRSPAPMAW